MTPMRIAVFASGGGSNLGALFSHFDDPRAARVGTIVCVASDKAGAGALARARERGVNALVLADHQDGLALRTLMHEHEVDLVVLAGYLKLVPPEIVASWPGRILNVHPSLLPAFGGAGMYGSRVHTAVIASGARVSGATVHFVNEHYDRGAIAAQWPVPVYPGDTPADLAARVLQIEHRLLPLVAEAVAGGVLALGEDGRVHGHIGVAPAESAPPSTRFSLAGHHPVPPGPPPLDAHDADAVARTAFANDVARLYPR